MKTVRSERADSQEFGEEMMFDFIVFTPKDKT